MSIKDKPIFQEGSPEFLQAARVREKAKHVISACEYLVKHMDRWGSFTDREHNDFVRCLTDAVKETAIMTEVMRR